MLTKHIAGLIPFMGFTAQQVDIIDLEAQRGIVDLKFNVSTDTPNQHDLISAGKISTMLDACITIAGIAKSGGVFAMPMQKMNTTFLRPVSCAVVFGKGAWRGLSYPFPG